MLRLTQYIFNFSKKLKIEMCRAWSFKRDLNFFKYEMSKEDPSLPIEI